MSTIEMEDKSKDKKSTRKSVVMANIREEKTALEKLEDGSNPSTPKNKNEEKTNTIERLGSGPGSMARLFDDLNPADLSWHNVTFNVPIKNTKGSEDRKDILSNVSGMVRSGHLLAIMGPSGCGKTTLMNILARRNVSGPGCKLTGDLMINGSSHPSFWKWMRYVAQEDTLMGSFTVRETVYYSAQFNLPEDISYDNKMVRVNKLISKLGLDVCADTKVGDIFLKGISGGQKRRLSIAVELISSPSILLLDEPTSGLDSASAHEVMKLLVGLSGMGHTILCTIHQPSSDIWQMFDELLLLSGGRQIYMGNADKALDYFEELGYPCGLHVNPSDHFLQITNTDFEDHADIDQLEKSFKDSNINQTLITNITSQEKSRHQAYKDSFGYKTGFLRQFTTLSHRFLLNNIRNPGIYGVRLAMYIMLSLMVGFMYWNLGDERGDQDVNARASLLFYVAAFLVFMSIAVLPFFMIDRATYLRETKNHYYSILPHVIAQFLSSLPGIFLIAFVSSIFVVIPSGLRNVWIFLADLFLSLVVAESYMAIIAALVPHYIIGMAIAAGTYGFFMLSEGAFIVRNDIPAYFIWGYWMGFHTYTYRIFMINEFKDLTLNSSLFGDGNDVISFYDMDDFKVKDDLLILFGYALILQVIYYIILRYQAKK